MLEESKVATRLYIINEFYDLLEDQIKALDLGNKPERIYNCDETSFATTRAKLRS